MATKQVLTREQAEEFTHNLGQITAGDYGLIDMAVNALQVPKAMEMTAEKWVQEYLGGYVQWTVEKRRKAVGELLSDGRSRRQVATILGIHESTVDRDSMVIEAEKGQPEPTPAAIEAEKSQPEPTPVKPKKLTAPARREAVQRMIEEGKTDAQMVVQFKKQGYAVGLSTITKERASIKLAEIKENLDSKTSPAHKKEAEAKIDDMTKQMQKGIMAAFGFDPRRTAAELRKEVFQAQEVGADFDVEGTIEDVLVTAQELWVIGAQKGLDVSEITRTIDRMKGE